MNMFAICPRYCHDGMPRFCLGIDLEAESCGEVCPVPGRLHSPLKFKLVQHPLTMAVERPSFETDGFVH